MAETLNPKAPALMEGDDSQPGTVTESMIREYVVAQGMLPPVSAEPFAAYMYQAWFDYEDDSHSDMTNDDVIQGGLAYWRGQ